MIGPDIRGMVYPAEPGSDHPLVIPWRGGLILPLFADAEKLEAFVKKSVNPPAYEPAVAGEDLLDRVAAYARSSNVDVEVIVEPEEIAPGICGALACKVGGAKEHVTTPPAFSTPYEADGIWSFRHAAWMGTRGGIPVCLRVKGTEYYPAFEEKESAERVLSEMHAPFDEVVRVRDPSLVVREIERLGGAPCRLAIGETVRRVGTVIELDHSKGGAIPRRVGSSSLGVRLRGKVVPVVVGIGFYAVRMLASRDYYVPVFDSTSAMDAVFAGEGAPTGSITIDDEAHFMRHFPEKTDDGVAVKLIGRLRRGPSILYDVITWRN